MALAAELAGSCYCRRTMRKFLRDAGRYFLAVNPQRPFDAFGGVREPAAPRNGGQAGGKRVGFSAFVVSLRRRGEKGAGEGAPSPTLDVQI